VFFAELTALSIKRQELTVAPTWLILSKVYCCILFSVCKEAHVNILSWYKLSRRVLLQNAELFVLVQWFLNQGAWKVYKGGASIWQRHIIEKQDNAKLMLFCFLYLIWRSGEARVTIANAKGDATKKSLRTSVLVVSCGKEPVILPFSVVTATTIRFCTSRNTSLKRALKPRTHGVELHRASYHSLSIVLGQKLYALQTESVRSLWYLVLLSIGSFSSWAQFANRFLCQWKPFKSFFVDVCLFHSYFYRLFFVQTSKKKW